MFEKVRSLLSFNFMYSSGARNLTLYEFDFSHIIDVPNKYPETKFYFVIVFHVVTPASGVWV